MILDADELQKLCCELLEHQQCWDELAVTFVALDVSQVLIGIIHNALTLDDG
jgi:hypothetical protein